MSSERDFFQNFGISSLNVAEIFESWVSDYFSYCSDYTVNIVQFGGFFTTGDTQKIKDVQGTSRAIFVKNPVGILVSGPNKCRKWVALIVNENKLGSTR